MDGAKTECDIFGVALHSNLGRHCSARLIRYRRHVRLAIKKTPSRMVRDGVLSYWVPVLNVFLCDWPVCCNEVQLVQGVLPAQRSAFRQAWFQRTAAFPVAEQVDSFQSPAVHI